MKRYGHILEKVADLDNLRLADYNAQKGGKAKRSKEIRRHNERAEANINELRRMILELDFPPVHRHPMRVKAENGKVRVIHKDDYFPWRILHHAIIQVIEPIMHNLLIKDSYSCIKGRGLQAGNLRMQQMIRRYPENKWFWKVDYKRFYESIPHELVLYTFRKRFKDERFIKLIEIAILSHDSGQEVVSILENEHERRKRNNHWCLY